MIETLLFQAYKTKVELLRHQQAILEAQKKAQADREFQARCVMHNMLYLKYKTTQVYNLPWKVIEMGWAGPGQHKYLFELSFGKVWPFPKIFLYDFVIAEAHSNDLVWFVKRRGSSPNSYDCLWNAVLDALDVMELNEQQVVDKIADWVDSLSGGG